MKTRYTFIFALFILVCTSCKDKDKDPEPDSCAGFAVTAQVDEDDISVQTTGGVAPYTYSLDGSNYGASNLFANKAMGDYTVYAKDAKGCVQSAPAAVNAFTDARDGQTYKTVKIGSQVWMAENLNYALPDSSWCYENEPDSCAKYGRLYNFNGAQLACPAGWHLPSNEEWSILEKTLGMSDSEIGKGGSRGTNEGDKLKVGGSTGFNALMAGMYQGGGDFMTLMIILSFGPQQVRMEMLII